MNILSGLRIVESVAFVAAPLSGMTLAQLGADVIRCDPLEGGLDAQRWPLAKNGRSLYWVGLNKGKRSIAVNTRTAEGQELVTALIASPGEGGGIFCTNLPATGWMSYEKLRTRRDDLIMLNVLGNADGTSAVDYTVNCAVGFPFATGPEHGQAAVNPVNHVLPAWDAVTGIMSALGLLAAERERRLTGKGQLVRLPLADVAMAMVGNLGWLAKAQINDEDHFSVGNYLYGAYGCEFRTRDARYVYVVAITRRMWEELGRTTGLTEKFRQLEAIYEVDLGKEGDRYRIRTAITALLEPWFAARTLADVDAGFAGSGVCWGPYRTFQQLVREDARCSTANPMFKAIEQPGIGSYLVPSSPLQFSLHERESPRRAPMLGEHTDEVLSELLAMTTAQIGALRDRKIVGGPIELPARPH